MKHRPLNGEDIYIIRKSEHLSVISKARMGKLYQCGKTIIRVYANDHLPPHFHVLTPDIEAIVDIATLRILAGALPSRVEREAFAWIAANKALVAAEWNRINPRFPIA